MRIMGTRKDVEYFDGFPEIAKKPSQKDKTKWNNSSVVGRYTQKFNTTYGPIEKTKKAFDKKKWRLQKYDNQFRMKKWEESRKKKILHQYHRKVRGKFQGFDVQKIYAELDGRGSEVELPHYSEENGNKSENIGNKNEIFSNTPEMRPTQKDKTRKKLNAKFQCKDQMKNKGRGIQKEELIKTEKVKKFFRQTKKGQPVMKERLEVMFQKIQKSVVND